MAGKNHGQFAKYNKEIENVSMRNPNMGYTDIARRVLGTSDTLSSNKELDLLRTYVQRHLNRTSGKDKSSPSKVLLFDLETSYVKGYFFSLYDNHIPYDNVIQDWLILTWSAKWLFDDEVVSMKLTTDEVMRGDDKRITQGIWNLLDECDVAIAHNCNKFDEKKANAKFLEHGLYLPSSYKTIDTLAHARKKFKMTSNRLDALGKKLGIGQKIDTPKGLWRDAVRCAEFGATEGVRQISENALKQMQVYCDGDVGLLESVYLAMRPYITGHPNMGLFLPNTGELICPTCGHHELKYIGEYKTGVHAYPEYRCKNCNSKSIGRNTQTPATTNPHVIKPSVR